VKVKLLKVVLPDTACEVPLSVIVPELWVKVPELEISSPTVNVPDGAVRVRFAPIVRSFVTVSELVPTIMNEPLNSMSAAISKKDKEVFLKAYENLTVSCNRCHTATQHEYIVIQTPTGNEFSNQKFVP